MPRAAQGGPRGRYSGNLNLSYGRKKEAPALTAGAFEWRKEARSYLEPGVDFDVPVVGRVDEGLGAVRAFRKAVKCFVAAAMAHFRTGLAGDEYRTFKVEPMAHASLFVSSFHWSLSHSSSVLAIKKGPPSRFESPRWASFRNAMVFADGVTCQ